MVSNYMKYVIPFNELFGRLANPQSEHSWNRVMHRVSVPFDVCDNVYLVES